MIPIPTTIPVLTTVEELRHFRSNLKGTLGFVPTMGALHAGHASLLQAAKDQSDCVILSLFVNPTQFDDPQDLEKYPKTFDADKALAEKVGVDAIFYPRYEDLYPDSFLYAVHEKKWSQLFCGAHRPGHFDGVLTVVLKLLNLVQPNFAFFGEKDFQQLQLIKGMVDALFVPVHIVAVATQRDADGLALSSRNQRLSGEEREKAPLLYQTLQAASSANEARLLLEQKGFKVEYVEDWRGRRLAAVRLGTVRLIDNVEIQR